MSSLTTIVFASGNAGKLREIERLLAALDVTVVPQSDYGVSEAEETGSTFAENAIIKARHAHVATGLAAIADDSGLVVDALDGRPGVLSARYAGRGASDADNIDKLLEELSGIDERSAAFHCAACFVADGRAEPLLAYGSWHGEILHERRGSRGFGYDPVFLDPTLGLAAAELSAEQKNQRSHRGQALRALLVALADSSPSPTGPG
ncbi:MAG TPA: RdgB/HAM1 family non-canonical purine NTP pyrophosphatase [Woeseiaceae bacterium]|nr:RdgB/HAM1 family non-canonical purine NTP pyrophosphatase [Woeseiaceae bacterium]